MIYSPHLHVRGGCRFLSLLALLALAFGALGDEPATALSITRFELGGATTYNAPGRNLVQRLNACPELAAKARPRKYGDAWDKLPAGMEADEHVSFVVATFGKRFNLLAFRFAGPDGAVSMAAWRPGLEAASTQKYSYINTIPPGPDAAASLAEIELAAAVRLQLAETGREREPVRIVVEAGKAEATATLTLDLDGGGSAMGGGMQEVNAEQLEAIRALAMAGAWELGMQPTNGSAAATLRLGVARVVEGFAVQATWEKGDTQRTVRRAKLEETLLYPGLVAVMRWARDWGPRVHDFVQVYQEAITPLAFDGRRLFYVPDGHAPLVNLFAVDVEPMLTAWRIDNPPRGSYLYTALRQPDGTPAVWRWNAYVGPVNAQSGIVGHTGWRGSMHPWGMLLTGDKTGFVADEFQLLSFEGTRTDWTADAPGRLAAGPAVLGDLAVVGTDTGAVLAFGRADGKPRWQTRLGGRLYGPIVHAGDHLLTTSQHGVLTALDAAGKTAWQVDLGDALIHAPWVVGDRVVTVSGLGDLRVLDAATGAEQARAARTVQVRYAALADRADKPVLATLDAAGTVAFHALPGLEPLDETPLAIRPVAQPLFVADCPVRWGQSDELMDRSPVLLVPDFNGILYLLRIP